MKIPSDFPKMKKDFSIELFSKYLETDNRYAVITMLDGTILKGFIIGLYKGKPEDGEPFIKSWHLCENDEIINLGIDVLGYRKGVIINQVDILDMKYNEDRCDEV
jgi:hypothetical protein